MPRRGATLTQADVARTIRAAKQAGAALVEVRPDGSMLVHLIDADARPTAPAEPVEAGWPADLVL
ncbi:hypothetical protein NPA31_007390 [Aurantimonas sp. MSK8Z-1]|nr:hypothetical protein [Aurantimonas sp. MSK8Z-1]MCW4114785.1 hypothetical protein [Aurantimonas sp. MSK8Z-1]